jgi:sarcosine/dimethylglycine N-methyltransferase
MTIGAVPAIIQSRLVMRPNFAQPAASLGRNLMEGRIGILIAVFEAA